MARYTGPRVRISRRFGVPIFGPSKYLERRNYGPGVHGPKSRRKHTDYGLGLIEKQKLRFHYAMQEKQFRLFLDMAKKSKGNTANTMMQLLEVRLDNEKSRLAFGVRVAVVDYLRKQIADRLARAEDASIDKPWLKRLRKLTCSALYVESAMPAISPTDENVQGAGTCTVQPEYSRL